MRRNIMNGKCHCMKIKKINTIGNPNWTSLVDDIMHKRSRINGTKKWQTLDTWGSLKNYVIISYHKYACSVEKEWSDIPKSKSSSFVDMENVTRIFKGGCVEGLVGTNRDLQISMAFYHALWHIISYNMQGVQCPFQNVHLAKLPF